ncbi:MBL fold metallo-hydrolase [Pacificimonas flava]|uniref:MBL fold metallo-hydrolase n=2 Tax=Pacificimonas TaxID=1960290 RepID=A0A219B7A9_9SPHN|nr:MULTISPECIES: MBL fold metallo-hydrolase [Pacificimonas]MBZ6378568.1 MBL fold metallo-hydrolase [Pacificimonas aurantium]OWV34151.1 MBL fold metallo-hydrolase [Pacificimonas flava]
MKVTMLGSGTSSGVPRIGNQWGACDPTEPKNRRRRVSVLVEAGVHKLIIDTGPDFREQCLSAGLLRLDAVLLTHSHADHTHGIDDIRQVMHLMGTPIPVHAAKGTWDHLYARFDYLFEGRSLYSQSAVAHTIDGPFEVGPLSILAFPQVHGPITSWGFRIEADGAVFCYSTDLNDLTPEAEEAVSGCDLWIVDALRRRPHPTHSHLQQTLEWIERLRPEHAVLTHMDNSMDYAVLSAQLPPHVEAGFDMWSRELSS